MAVTLTAAATLTAAVAATVGPTAEAAVPAIGARSAAHVRTIGRATTAAERAKVTVKTAAGAPVTIGSETKGGKYVTVIHCSGEKTPPPIKVGQPGRPLVASGIGPSAPLLSMLSKPNPYKTVYTCTVTVKEKTVTPKAKVTATGACNLGSSGVAGKTGVKTSAKACHKHVTLNTGFGGMAKQVAGHHPGH